MRYLACIYLAFGLLLVGMLIARLNQKCPQKLNHPNATVEMLASVLIWPSFVVASSLGAGKRGITCS